MTDTTTKQIRQMAAQCFRERNWRGFWFWATWLLSRWHIPAIMLGIAGAVIGTVTARWILGVA